MTLRIEPTDIPIPGSWNYEPELLDYSEEEWQPKTIRVKQLMGNTQVTGFREYPTDGILQGKYPTVNGMWACARATGPYRGRFPGGFMERVETFLKVFDLIQDTERQSLDLV